MWLVYHIQGERDSRCRCNRVIQLNCHDICDSTQSLAWDQLTTACWWGRFVSIDPSSLPPLMLQCIRRHLIGEALRACLLP
jgi:hypothetical protein